MTKIILVRHGHVEGISPERFRGRADLELTLEGRRQAEATARRIEASWTPDALYASPLSRARTTAEAIGRPLGLTPTPVPGLVDIDYGEWQGLTPDEGQTQMARGARHLVPGAALGGDPGRREPAGCARPRSCGITGRSRAACEGNGRGGRARQCQSHHPVERARSAPVALSAPRPRSLCDQRDRLLGGRVYCSRG